VEDDIFLLQWSGNSDVATMPHGVAAFIIRDGLIQRQAEWFIVIPKEDRGRAFLSLSDAFSEQKCRSEAAA